MPRGIPYFPLDVHLDDKFELIEADFGLTGFGVVVKLYQKIYSIGYYVEWDEDVALLFARKIGAGCNVVSEIVSAAIRRGIFNQELYDKYSILTSEGIQKRYFEAISRRKQVEVKSAYLLVNVGQILKNANILEENVNISSENVNIFKQRKEEKSKVKESKVEKRKEDVGSGNALTSHSLQKIIDHYSAFMGKCPEANAAIISDYLDNGMEDKLIISLIDYCKNRGKKSDAYIMACISGSFNNKVLTLNNYKGAVNGKKNKFNNYVDTNKEDYSDFAEQILKDMLGENDDG